MIIQNYIMRGGEDLNSPPTIVGAFSKEAQKGFDNLHVKLSQDDEEKESFIECPVDENNRLFIRAIWYEPSGDRPKPYFVGFLVPRFIYLEVGEYYKINRGLCSVPFSEIRRAAHTKAPIEINTEWPLPQKRIGQPFDVLSDWKRIGETSYHSNLIELLLSVSVNTIDDWFSRLIIAANPDISDPAFHVVISKKKPINFRKTNADTQHSFLKADRSEGNRVFVDSFDSTQENQTDIKEVCFASEKNKPREYSTGKSTIMESSAVQIQQKTIIKKTGKMKEVLFCWLLGLTIVSLFLNFSLWKMIKGLEKRDQDRQGFMNSNVTTIQALNTQIEKNNDILRKEIQDKLKDFDQNYGWIKNLNEEDMTDWQKTINKINDEEFFGFLVYLSQNEEYLRMVIDCKKNSNTSEPLHD